MPGRRKDDAEHSSITEEVCQGADFYLQYFGWPKWPPKEAPTYFPWWENEIDVAPTSTHLPYKNLVEFSGTPQAGRTTLERLLQRQIFRTGSRKKVKLETVDQDNLFMKGPERMVSIPLELIYPFADEDDIQILMDPKEDAYSWVGLIFYQLYKTQFWTNKIKDLSSHGSPNKIELVLNLRGLVDSAVLQNAIASEYDDPSLSIPKDFVSLKRGMIKELLHTQAISREQDSIILIGIDQKEAQERRTRQGKTQPSWVSDSSFYNHWSAWYGYWIQNIWPIMHKEYGTGLLVLNGNKPPAENIQKIKSHLREITNAWP